MRRLTQALAWLFLLLTLAACGGGQLSDADRIATEVAIGRAAAQILTAEAEATRAAAPTDAPAPTAPAPAPSDSAAPGPTAAPSIVAPTLAPAPTAPSAPTTAPPTPADLIPLPTSPPPTEPPVARVPDEPVRPPGGSSNGVVGELRLRGFFDQPLAETPVVRGVLALRAVVNDPDVGSGDGAGVLSVSFFVLDPQGSVVYETVEEHSAFCLSGGDEPGCALIDIGPGGTWPNGAPVSYGVHQINMDIAAGADGVNNGRGAFWFTFVDLQPPTP